MISLWILLDLGLLISVLICCQAGNGGMPVVSYSDNGSGNTLKLNIAGPVDESVVRSSPVTVTGNTEPGVDMMINGLFITVENGHFSVMVKLEPGPNIIDILVKDTSGKQVSKYLTVVYVP